MKRRCLIFGLSLILAGTMLWAAPGSAQMRGKGYGPGNWCGGGGGRG